MKSAFALLALLVLTASSARAQDEDCVSMDTAYGGSDILVGGFHNLQPSWEECQISCQAITNCMYWTWFSDATSSEEYCELKFDISSLPYDGAISGPKEC